MTSSRPSQFWQFLRETWIRVRALAEPRLRRWGAWWADWLVRVGWGKFLLLAVLLMVAGGVLSSLFFERRAEFVIETAPADVKVDVRVTPEGVRIQGPGGRDAAPKEPSAGSADSPPSVQVDEKGVRIRADKDGKQVSIVVDEKGVRIQEAPSTAPEAPAAPSAPGGVDVPLPPGADSQAAEAAVEAVRERIEQIVEAQVERKVERRVRHATAESSDWMMSFIFLLIVTGIILKIALGGKKKAESRAAAASASAAEEGLKRQLAEAQLKMMQAQVEPHFLFNTLASVDYLIETDPARASQMQKNLIAYLRASLPQMREGSTTLGKEVAQCRAYLEILKVRMEDRLQYAIVVPQGLLTAQFPPMMLQSLVENAIKHGLEPKAEGGAVTIAADVSNGLLRVTVADTGLGVANDAGTGVGLSNIRERLVQLYGSRAQFIVASNSPAGTIATIEVPYSWEAQPQPHPASV